VTKRSIDLIKQIRAMVRHAVYVPRIEVGTGDWARLILIPNPKPLLVLSNGVVSRRRAADGGADEGKRAGAGGPLGQVSRLRAGDLQQDRASFTSARMPAYIPDERD